MPTLPEAHLIALRDSLPGRVLLGSGGNRYPVGARLGEGGQGWVFRANWNEERGQPVVIKILRPDSASQEALDRFQREAVVLQMLSQQATPNPHIVRFFDHAYADAILPGTSERVGLAFTVLEYVAGPTLENVIARAGGTGLATDRAMRFIRHVVLALQQVHAQHLVHRDLKPSNILIDAQNGLEVAKVTDFGLVKLFDARFQRTQMLAGATIGYAPPEQFEARNERVGPSTDVYALAAVTYELLCGRPAFPIHEGEPPYVAIMRSLSAARPSLARESLPPELATRPDVVRAIDAVLARGLSIDPSARHPSVTAFWDALHNAFGRGGVPQRERSIQSPVQPPAQPPSGDPTVRAGSLGQPPRPASAMWRWKVVTAGGVGPLRAASFGGGGVLMALGPNGLLRWSGTSWSAFAMRQWVDLTTVRALAVGAHGDAYLAGEPALALRVTPGGAAAAWNFADPRLSLVAAYAPARGATPLVAGARSGERPCAIVAELSEPIRLFEAPGVPRLRGVTRVASGAVMACGEGGTIVTFAADAPPSSVSLCAAPLYAIAPLSDGSAVVCGGGGFVFQVWPDGRQRLEPIQTTRDLFALAVDEQGAAWAGGAAARLLRRRAAGWTREAQDFAHGATVIAITASATRVLAACDDGLVIEGSLA